MNKIITIKPTKKIVQTLDKMIERKLDNRKKHLTKITVVKK